MPTNKRRLPPVQLTQRLRRKLRGTPTPPTGEFQIAALLSRGAVNELQALLDARADDVGDDLWAIVRSHLDSCAKAGREPVSYLVKDIPPKVWDRIVQRAREQNIKISTALRDAILRDDERIVNTQAAVRRPGQELVERLQTIAAQIAQAPVPRGPETDAVARIAAGVEELVTYQRRDSQALAALVLVAKHNKQLPKAMETFLAGKGWFQS